MKNSHLLILMLLFWSISDKVFAQTKNEITIKGNLTISEALSSFARQSKIDYSFDPSKFSKTAQQVNIVALTSTFALKNLAETYEFKYQFLNPDLIVIKPSLRFKTKGKVAPTSLLLGVTLEQDGNICPFTKVYLPELNMSTLSDANGEYAFVIPYPRIHLTIIGEKQGYQQTERYSLVKGETQVSIQMVQVPKSFNTVSITSTEKDLRLFVPVTLKSAEIDQFSKVVIPDDSLSPKPDSIYRVPVLFSIWPTVTSGRVFPSAVRPSFSLNLGYASHAGVNGAEIGVFVNQNTYATRGFQAAGFANIAGGEVEGVQVAGFSNFNRLSVRGAQFAGLVNLSRGQLTGAQFGGIGSVVGESTTGLQVGGIFALNNKHLKGAQLSGIMATTNSLDGAQVSGVVSLANDAKGAQIAGVISASNTLNGIQLSGSVGIANTMKGIQISGGVSAANQLNGFQISGGPSIANKVDGGQISGGVSVANTLKGIQVSGGASVAMDSSTGIQISGGANFAKESFTGIQISPINYAKRMKGIQIGVFNITDSLDGYSIGILNYNKSGRNHINIYSNSNGLGGISFQNAGKRIGWEYGLFQAYNNKYPVQGLMSAIGAKVYLGPFKSEAKLIPYLGARYYQPLNWNEASKKTLFSAEAGFAYQSGKWVTSLSYIATGLVRYNSSESLRQSYPFGSIQHLRERNFMSWGAVQLGIAYQIKG